MELPQHIDVRATDFGEKERLLVVKVLSYAHSLQVVTRLLDLL